MNSDPSTEKVTTWATVQVVFLTLFVVCVFLTFWLLYELRLIAFLLLVAIVLGTAIRPAVEWLRHRGIPRIGGVMLMYVLIAALLTGFLALMLPLLAEQTTAFSQNLPHYYTNMRQFLIQSDNRLLMIIGWRIPGQLQFILRADPSTEEVLNQVTQTVFYINAIVKGLLGTLAVFLLAYYWTQEGNGILRSILRRVRAERREQVREFLRVAQLKMGGYVRGQGLLCLLVAIAAFILYALIGLPFTLVLAVFAGLMEMIPIVGPALGAIPALLVALSVDPQKAIWVLLATAFIQLLENTFLVPRIMKNSMGVNPIVILLSLVAFSSVLGFPGAVLALPLSAIMQLFIDRILLASGDETKVVPVTGIGAQPLVDESRDLVERIQTASINGNTSFRELPEEDRIEFQGMAQELRKLLVQITEEDEPI